MVYVGEEYIGVRDNTLADFQRRTRKNSEKSYAVHTPLRRIEFLSLPQRSSRVRVGKPPGDAGPWEQ